MSGFRNQRLQKIMSIGIITCGRSHGMILKGIDSPPTIGSQCGEVRSIFNMRNGGNDTNISQGVLGNMMKSQTNIIYISLQLSSLT